MGESAENAGQRERMEVLSRAVIARCRAMGFALAGVCECSPSEHAEHVRAWFAQGRHGSMAYLARLGEERLDPRRVLPEARAIIVVADQYAPRGDASPVKRDGVGRVARYAHGEDYHVLIKDRLHALRDELIAEHPGEHFRAFCDTAPILEREHAQRAGLGWIGKNTLLIHPRLGSYTLLGGLLTSLPLVPPREQERHEDHCGSCTRCIDACPTGAISAYSVDASRCISYLTIERREPTPPDLREKVSDWIFGCDVCQEVCPHNAPVRAAADDERYAPRVNDAYRGPRRGLDLLAVLGWTAEDRARELRGSAMKRATLEMIRRNAATAMENQRRAAGEA
ncbi:MAG: tRNA epoxyqueuosine(34) reductase QueG [Phycisphaerales bacterium]|nr:tRNA epoxyqueuosine(34) reductase QueG [Phycisphaeraceae bacterium]